METDTQIEIAEMKKDISYIKKEVGENKRTAEKNHNEVLSAIKELGDKKANKWVEDALKWLIYLIVGAVFTALIGLVVIN